MLKTCFKRLYNHMLASIMDSNATEKFWRLRTKAKAGGVFRYIHIIRYEKYLKKRGAYIPLSANIEGKCFFPHGVNGIYISSGAYLGANCILFHQVTIGSNTIVGSKGFGAPKLGKCVMVGAGAKIIGGVIIGDNVRIGANCAVTESVESNTTVVLPHFRVIVRDDLSVNEFYPFDKQ